LLHQERAEVEIAAPEVGEHDGNQFLEGLRRQRPLRGPAAQLGEAARPPSASPLTQIKERNN
ncbi:MAG: hypothetical protein KAR37_13440, partial [Alphaproteobacteria bacterium]|nr:hypothetical protein [Alphaproteobacteria bacterium]